MNLLQRLPQSTKILIAGLLLVAGVATWFLAIYRPSQQPNGFAETAPPAEPVQVETNPAQPPAQPAPVAATKPAEGQAAKPDKGTPTTNPPAGNAVDSAATPAKPLEVLPVPFLKSDTAAATPGKTQSPKPGTQTSKPVTAAAPRPRIQVPPNPFVPLVVEEPLLAGQPSQTNSSLVPPTASNPAVPSTRVSTPPAPSAIPLQQQRVQVRPPVAQLPRANFPTARNPQTSGQTSRPAAATPQTTVRQPIPPVAVAQAPKPVKPRPSFIRPTTRLTSSGQPVSGLGTGALPIRLNPLDREVPILPPLTPVMTAEVSPPLTTPQTSKPPAVETPKAELPAPTLGNEPPAPVIKTEAPTTPKVEPVTQITTEPPAPVKPEQPSVKPEVAVKPEVPSVKPEVVVPQPVVTGADQGILQGGPNDGGKGLDLLKVEMQPQSVQRPDVRRTAPTPVVIEVPKTETIKPNVITEVKPEIKAEVKPEVKPEVKAPINEVKPQPKTETPAETKTEVKAVTETKPAPVESALDRYVRESGLRLTGVVLGPTSVGIFQFKNGEYLVLPVGRTLPDSEVLLKSLNAREALLVRGSESVNLELQQTN